MPWHPWRKPKEAMNKSMMIPEAVDPSKRKSAKEWNEIFTQPIMQPEFSFSAGELEKVEKPEVFKPDPKLIKNTRAQFKALNERLKENMPTELPMPKNEKNDILLYRFRHLLFEKNFTSRVIYVYAVHWKRNTVSIIDEFEYQCSFREECELYYTQNFYKPYTQKNHSGGLRSKYQH